MPNPSLLNQLLDSTALSLTAYRNTGTEAQAIRLNGSFMTVLPGEEILVPESSERIIESRGYTLEPTSVLEKVVKQLEKANKPKSKSKPKKLEQPKQC